MRFSRYLGLPLLALLIVIQVTVLSRLPIFGLTPQFLLLMALAWGLARGINEAFLWTVVAGLFLDLYSLAPLGVSSLAALAGVGIAVFLLRNYPASRIIRPALAAALATLIYWFVYLLLIRIIVPAYVGNLDFLGIGQLDVSARAPGLLRVIAREYRLSGPILQLALRLALIHALLLPPMLWLIQLLGRLRGPRPVEI